MPTIVDKITEKIKETEAANFASFSAAAFPLERRQKPINILPLMTKDFFVIAECKKGSPSRGIIRADYHPSVIAAAYQRAGASAISVITEENFFYGSRQHLPLVKRAVRLPVLRKDFLIHPYQVYESYNLGADFVLLIVACLDDLLMTQLYSLSLSLGMQVLLEVHNVEELERALALKPQLIGINNRDLKTFRVDIRTSFELKKRIPREICVISESGIAASADIDQLKRAGFAGALIGESLLREEDIEAALLSLLGKGRETNNRVRKQDISTSAGGPV